MMAIERSEVAVITTGKTIQDDVAVGDPITMIGQKGSPTATAWIGSPLPWCLPLHSLRSFRRQAGTTGYPEVTFQVIIAR